MSQHSAPSYFKSLPRQLETDTRIILTALVIAALSVTLLLIILAAGLDNAVVLLPAFLAIGFLFDREVIT